MRRLALPLATVSDARSSGEGSSGAGAAGRAGRLAAACLIIALLIGWLSAASSEAAPPSNDNFSDAAPFGAVPGSVGGSNVDATTETGEPASGVKSTVWWHWTATASGRYRVDLCDSTPFWSAVQVFRGNAVNSLIEVTVKPGSWDSYCLDRFGEPDSDLAAVSFDAAAGTTYYFRAASSSNGLARESANVVLSVRRTPLNDNFSAAAPLVDALPIRVPPASNREATTEDAEPIGDMEGSLWWRWTAPKSGTVTVDNCASFPLYPSQMGIFTGGAIHLLRPVQVDWKTCPNYQGGHDALYVGTFTATEGITYHITVGTNTGPIGDQRSDNIRLALRDPDCEKATKQVKKTKKNVKKTKKKVKRLKQKKRNASGNRKRKLGRKLRTQKSKLKKQKRKLRSAKKQKRAAC